MNPSRQIKTLRLTMLVLSLFAVLITQPALAQLKLPKLISDGMVLQRDAGVNIWGWANAGSEVNVSFNNNTLSTRAGNNRYWEVKLKAQKAGVGGNVVIKSGGESVTVKNVVFGDVWLCSGQSNMEFDMERIAHLNEADIAGSNNPDIRQFLVKRVYSFKKNDDAEGQWVAASPQTVCKFTAVGYYMARALYARYHVPIGIIHASWGGTPIEAWISEPYLEGFNRQLNLMRAYRDTLNIAQLEQQNKEITANWHAEANRLDKGNAPGAVSLAQGSAGADWGDITMPGYWQTQLGNLNGIVWYKKEINVPVQQQGKDAWLELGLIDDADQTYFNGIKVGGMSNRYQMRRYKIPGNLIKAGNNIITIRITNTDGNGGVVPGKQYRFTSGSVTASLAGNWKYKVGASVAQLPAAKLVSAFRQASVLYNGMIAPLTAYNIKAIAWYQGEANSGNAAEYRRLLPSLISNWREDRQDNKLPFLVVQLPNFGEKTAAPAESPWAMVRDAQLYTVTTVPHTGLAVTIDAGEANDVHPANKKVVGERLALAAQKVVYGDKSTTSPGPLYKGMKAEDNKLIITFSNTGKGLLAGEDKSLQQFAIAGADNKFVWATAIIKNGQVVVWNDLITNPVSVRYAWANNPEGCNLYNADGLPASPFQATIPQNE